MPVFDTNKRWGWPSIAAHWLTALAVFGLFALGLWMVDLGYYSDWYHRAPYWHKSVGMLLLLLWLARLGWRLFNRRPRPAEGVSKLEQRLATGTHLLLYLLLLATMLAGYLISTAEGEPIEVFGLFRIPATITGIEAFGLAQEDLAGLIHEYLAWSIIILAGLHAAGAFKHHFIDRDRTLLRMLGSRR